jgi:hypothetical protein
MSRIGCNYLDFCTGRSCLLVWLFDTHNEIWLFTCTNVQQSHSWSAIHCITAETQRSMQTRIVAKGPKNWCDAHKCWLKRIVVCSLGNKPKSLSHNIKKEWMILIVLCSSAPSVCYHSHRKYFFLWKGDQELLNENTAPRVWKKVQKRNSRDGSFNEH